MKLYGRVSLAAFFAVFSACGLYESDDARLSIFSTVYDFSESDYGWVHGFAGYPAGPDDSTYYELKHAYTNRPGGTGGVSNSHMLSGHNHSRDLFMFLKRQITGLKPNTDYTITFSIELATDLTANLFGASGTYKSVYLKAGATQVEPKSIIEAGYYVMNIDKGDYLTAGEDMITLGEILTPGNATGFNIITRNNTMANSRYVSKTNSDGELWLIIGSDSEYEGITTLYYTKVNVVFSAP